MRCSISTGKYQPGADLQPLEPFYEIHDVWPEQPRAKRLHVFVRRPPGMGFPTLESGCYSLSSVIPRLFLRRGVLDVVGHKRQRLDDSGAAGASRETVEQVEQLQKHDKDMHAPSSECVSYVTLLQIRISDEHTARRG